MAVPQTGEPQSMQDQDLVEWLRDREEPESKETKHPDTVPQEIKPDETELRSHKDGFRLLLCGRSESTDSRANFFNIPFNSKDASSRDPQTQDSPAQGARKKYDLQDVLKRFPVHVHMGQVIQRHTPYFSVVDIPAPTKGKIPFLTRSYLNLIVAFLPEATRKIIYTAIFDTGLEGFKTNLAFTSTYFPSNKTSFGIILGCTEQDIKNATTLLNKCGSSRNHQLLLPAVFLRLQRQRLAGIRKSHTKYSIELQDNIEEILAYRSGQQPYEFGVRPSKISDCASNLSKLCTNGHVMVADLKIASRQLNRLKRHAEELEKKNTGDKNMEMSSKNTRCFLDLFDEIAEDIEYVSGVISINVKATTTTANEVTYPPLPPLVRKNRDWYILW
ncbi:hypothetical protein CEP54_013435 [Fusarium duplospermum]|uniref:Uncharacterized protein n=1 Tax=Fusarium duplospermum TaxID=1325734 RepID=A0A428P2Z6_9HYPO|nr:hypothetical protein CEP54_013435 [Fusarium duplospermum]